MTDEMMQKTVAALKENGMDAVVVANGDEAKAKVLEMLPEGAEVMTMTSVTLEETGIVTALENGGYDLVRIKLENAVGRDKQRFGAAPEWTVGSVHAVTQDGKVVIASNTGSQLPAYAYGADHVIWVVGQQKIVENLDAAIKRVYGEVLPLESERAHKAYGVEGSFVSKLLIVNREIKPGRITVILVKEKLGF